MGKFLRENIVLVVGAALPVVVVALFLAATYIPRLLVDPPQYDFFFAKEQGYSSQPVRWRYKVEIREGRTVRVSASRSSDENHYGGERLYLYEHSNGAVREILFPDPTWPEANTADETEDEIEVVVEVPELADIRIDPRLQAPDGYEYSEPRPSGGALFGLFYRSRGADVTIRKNGAVVEIPSTDGTGYYYSNIRFLGWVVEPSGR